MTKIARHPERKRGTSRVSEMILRDLRRLHGTVTPSSWASAAELKDPAAPS